MITVALTPDVTLDLEDRVALRLYRRLEEHFRTNGEVPSTEGSLLSDDHPLWGRHSGGTGHDGREWSVDDEALAEAFYAQLTGKAKLFFDLLLDHPGQQLSVDDLVAASGGKFANSFSVAGAINGLRKPYKASGRRYPFYWWEGSPTRYAVKQSVAALFNAAQKAAG